MKKYVYLALLAICSSAQGLIPGVIEKSVCINVLNDTAYSTKAALFSTLKGIPKGIQSVSIKPGENQLFNAAVTLNAYDPLSGLLLAVTQVSEGKKLTASSKVAADDTCKTYKVSSFYASA